MKKLTNTFRGLTESREGKILLAFIIIGAVLIVPVFKGGESIRNREAQRIFNSIDYANSRWSSTVGKIEKEHLMAKIVIPRFSDTRHLSWKATLLGDIGWIAFITIFGSAGIIAIILIIHMIGISSLFKRTSFSYEEIPIFGGYLVIATLSFGFLFGISGASFSKSEKEDLELHFSQKVGEYNNGVGLAILAVEDSPEEKRFFFSWADNSVDAAEATILLERQKK